VNYAILWSEAGGPVIAGKVELRDGSLIFDGTNGTRRRFAIALADVVSVRIARGPGDRLQGRPVLLLDTSQGDVRVATLNGTGALHELADLIQPGRIGVEASRP
jgi:hypothetical protein